MGNGWNKWVERNSDRIAQPELFDEADVGESSTSRSNEEHQAQAALIRHCNYDKATRPALGLIFAIPNGGHRHPAVASRLKDEGVKAGVPDLFLPVARPHPKEPRLYHGLWIEMKVEGGRVSKPQKRFLGQMEAEGYAIAVPYGAEEAYKTIIDYLDGKHRNPWP